MRKNDKQPLTEDLQRYQEKRQEIKEKVNNFWFKRFW